MKIRRPARWAASVCAVGALLAVSACQSSDEGSESGDPATEVDPASAEIRGWDDACAILEPDLIAEQLGADYDEDGPVHVGTNAGMFLGAISCNALFRVESDPDQQQGFMYLHISPSDDAELAKFQYDEIWEDDFASNSDEDPTSNIMLTYEEEMEGEWDEAAIFVTTGHNGDRVWAYYLEGSYMVQIQLQWGPDSEVHHAAQRGEEDLSEFAEFDFTPLDIGRWVKNTYLPQIHQTITDKIAEGTGS